MNTVMGGKMGTETKQSALRSNRIARRYIIFFFAFFALFLAALLNDSWLLFRATYFLGLAGVFGFLWTRFNSTRGIRASFAVPVIHLEAGKTLTVSFSVQNSSALPRLWLEVSLCSTIPGEHINQVVSLSGNGNKKWSVSVTSLKRGLYSVGPLNVSSRDPFGLLVQRQVYGEPLEIIVFPETEDLPFFDPRLDERGAARLSRRSHHFLFSQAGGVRPYVSGDSYRRIHWPSTAKTGKLMVKVLDSDATDYVWLVLDMQREAHSADGKSEEHLVKVAASVAKALLEAGRAVGLIYYGEQRRFVEVGRGRDQLFSVLRALAVAEARGHTPLHQVISNEMPVLSSGSSCIVLGASLEPELVFAAEELREQGASPRMVLLDADGFGMKASLPVLLSRLKFQSIGVYVVSPGRSLANDLNDSGQAVAALMPIELR